VAGGPAEYQQWFFRQVTPSEIAVTRLRLYSAREVQFKCISDMQ
jgi:hypothetical protein